MTYHISFIMAFLALFGCKSQSDLPTVTSVDLNRYMGRWYEIARLPNSFEKGLECITANYSLRDDGRVTVLNRGKTADGWKDAEGIAKIPNAEFPGILKVSFFRPFWGDYYIIDLDTAGYQYVLVGSPSRDYLWILAREPQLDPAIYDQLTSKAQSLGFATDQLIRPRQDCVQPD